VQTIDLAGLGAAADRRNTGRPERGCGPSATARVRRLGDRDKLLIINKAGIIFDGPNARTRAQ